MESNFGRFSGTYPVVPALATLAWDGRRSTFFRGELLDAHEVLNREDIELERLRGSWAGAMGQPQFMPSSFLQFAEDFDADGRRDIWGNPADIFASVGNYLRGHGWVTGYRWGREVHVEPDVADKIQNDVARRNGSCSAKRSMIGALPLEAWQRLGVRLLDGSRLPIADQEAWLVQGASRNFLVYQNYDVILAYNCAHAYAVSVALLSERISG
jgi:membrane-bound lytic murein transglycosylase B